MTQACDPLLYEQALQTEGFFSEEEGRFLIRAVSEAPDDAVMLEIGSYFGRSTLFALSAVGPRQRWLIVDSFRCAAAYSGHSYWSLLERIVHPRAALLPMTLLQASSHIPHGALDLVFIDGDHSFYGVTSDVTIAVSLARQGATLLCHDYSELFPGVFLVLDLLMNAAVLRRIDTVGTLARYEVLSRPSWLLDPAVYRGGQMPIGLQR
jgi:methyltransferase family protein